MTAHDVIKNQLYQIALHGKKGEIDDAKFILDQTETMLKDFSNDPEVAKRMTYYRQNLDHFTKLLNVK